MIAALLEWAPLVLVLLFNIKMALAHARERRTRDEVREDCGRIAELINECDKVLAMHEFENPEARRLRRKIEDERQRLMRKGQAGSAVEAAAQ